MSWDTSIEQTLSAPSDTHHLRSQLRHDREILPGQQQEVQRALALQRATSSFGDALEITFPSTNSAWRDELTTRRYWQLARGHLAHGGCSTTGRYPGHGIEALPRPIRQRKRRFWAKHSMAGSASLRGDDCPNVISFLDHALSTTLWRALIYLVAPSSDTRMLQGAALWDQVVSRLL